MVDPRGVSSKAGGGRAVAARPPRGAVPRADTTVPFGAVFALPGQETTRGDAPPAERAEAGGGDGRAGRAFGAPLAGGGGLAGPTLGFAGVLPLPCSGEAAPAGAVAPGAALEGFVLTERLASDAVGERWRARHPEHGECWVDVRSGPASAARGPAFLLETRLRSALADASLAPAVGMGAAPAPWAAIRAVSGPTLREVLAGGDLLPERMGRIAAGLAEALALAHGRCLVHGDITPEDVRLPSPDEPVLLGFSRFTRVGPDGERVSAPGAPSLGPPAYVAPEVLRGGRPDAASDVYALGALLFEGLNGSPPFAGSTAQEVMQAGLERWPEKPDLRDTSPRARLLRVAWRCLCKEPGDRPPSAAALAADLREVRGEEPAVPRGAAAGRPPRSLRLLLAAALLCAAALAAAAVELLLSR